MMSTSVMAAPYRIVRSGTTKEKTLKPYDATLKEELSLSWFVAKPTCMAVSKIVK
jgi:hypothetical protein